MKLPSWLNGRRPGITPPLSKHVEYSAEALRDRIAAGQEFHMVGFPDRRAKITPVLDRWPLILSVETREGSPLIGFEVENEAGARHWVLPGALVTVAECEW